MSDSFRVLDAYHGQRLDVVLARMYPMYSRNHLAHFIKTGDVLLDGLTVKPNIKVKMNQMVTIHTDFKVSKHPGFDNMIPESCDFTILYEDNDILVVNKPADLTVHPGVGTDNHTLANGLIARYPDLMALPRCGIVHRLDKDTTGAMVIAKTLEAQTELIRMIQAREVTREYIALVQGHIDTNGVIRTMFGRHPKNRLKMSVLKDGKKAVTHYCPLAYFDFLTLLQLQLETGRTHQIRVHLAHMHHPIVGDKLYGKPLHFPKDTPIELMNTLKSFNRQALHAKTLSFLHPISKIPLTIEADLPHDLTTLISICQS